MILRIIVPFRKWLEKTYNALIWCTLLCYYVTFELCFLRFDLHLLSFLSLCLPGHTGRFIRVVFCTSLLFVLAHICFQTVLYTYPPLNIAIGDNCSQWDTISRNIGLSRLPLDDPWSVLRLLCPDMGVCVVALTTIVLCGRLVRNREMVAAANITSVSRVYVREIVTRCGPRGHWGVGVTVECITLPSAFSAIYFLLFIGVCTWWACHLPISHLGFNALCVMVGFFTAGHMVCLYVYQSLLAQALFPPHSLWARLFGLKAIIIPGNCSSPYDLNLNADHDWPVYVNPGILFLLYITLATVLKTGYHATSNQVTSLPVHSREEYKGNNKSALDHITYSCLLGVCLFSPGAHGAPGGHQQGESPFFMLGKVVMQQSYVCALIAMMVWSITYHSWLTFVLLLWACLIWMLRHAATLCSPFILLYGLALCCLQYVWAMELQPELPTMVGTMSLRQLGLDRAQHPCLRLGAMLLFTLTFWLLVRQSVKENFSRKRKMTTPLQEVTSGGQTSFTHTHTHTHTHTSYLFSRGMLMSSHAKYWIYVCGGMFIMVSFAGKLVGYKIIYMLLFLLCLCLYQVYYSLWRRLLKLFWWLVVAYTMLVLISIYTYQFEDFPGYWRNFTGFTEEQLAAIGLETFALSELFSSILIPGFFLLACILQLHYFHKPFMRITDLEHVPGERTERSGSGHVGVHCEEEDLATNIDEEAEDKGETTTVLMPSKWALVMDRLLVLSRRFSDTLTQVQVFLWRLLELHILKMVAFFSVWVSLEEPSVMNLVLVVLWSLAMPYSRFGPMASCLSTVWVCVIIVCKMLYQLSVVNPVEYSSNCSLPLTNETNLLPEEMMNSSLYEEPVDPARWFGIRKDATVLGYSKNHLIVLMLLVFEATVYRHQSHHYRQLQRSPPTIPALFPAATRDTLDQGLVPCLKYLLNYTFYKFGLEICFLMTVNVIGQRMNFLVIIHGCWLVAILVRRRRAAIATIWPKYCLFLSIFMIYQYLLCVGMPPALCIDYPWRWNTPVLINSALVKWIFLPDFYTVPNSKNLIADFALLMCASQQWKVFECEHKEEWMVLAGENTDDPEPMEGRLFNPAPNFINCRSYLDMAKVLVFRHLFWFVLSVVFITGATRISVFGLGYLLACFFFLLFGTRLLVKSSRTRLALWDCLIIYNVAVIVSKNMLSVLMFCGLLFLISVCTCSLPVEEAGVIWDSICFLCLLLQRRVFLSYYFLHVTAELQASLFLSSRGFELFRSSIVKNIKFHQQAERKSLSQLKRSQFFIEELAQSREFYNNQSRLLKLLFAMYNLLAANSELVCYFIIVLNNAVSASVISLALPILVFLWAMLAVPRPTKKFWMTAIVYTEVMVVVKYLFQFGFFPWNSVHEMTLNEDKPFFPPCILGLEKTDNYIRYDLLQLLALFFHRSLLMRYGLWDHEGPLEEQSPSPERDEDGRKKEGRGEEEESRVSSTSTLDNLEITELDQLEKVGGFFRGILHAEYRTATDVYALMFLTDVVDFIIIVFGFWAFGKHSAAADIASTLSEDQVPEAFLVMLLLQFSTMIIDRALYLRKAVLGKLIFQVILVFGIHLWMFFILPAVTERKFNQNFVAQLWYFVKCIYFGLSAYQIRCGYPTRILGNILTKKYNHLNLFLFQGFRLVPFLVELRAVMDWVWTDTTLSLSNWMCVEDIYANIFIIKCSRETEKKYPQPKGQKKKKIVKYGMGGLIIFFLICIIWFPLLFISLVRSVVGVVNHPIDVTVTVKLGGYESLFTMSVQQQSIQPFTQAEYDQLTHNFGDNAVAMQFITLYGYEDIVTAMIEGSSGSVWRISPPSRQEVIKELLGSPVDLTLRLAWTFQRDLGKGGTVEHTFDKHSIDLEPGNPVRADLASLLVGNRSEPVFVPHMIPNYIRAPNGAEAKPVNQLYKGEDGYLNITLSLKSDRSLNGSGNQEWWDIAIAGCRSSSCGVLPIVIFNDKVSPPSLGFLAGYGIMGLYLSVVLVIGKFVRGFFSEISHSIMFEELPCVDRILKLCTDIFLVRETGELELEEELYSKLIFLYRSPETMIKWTRDMHSRDHNRY
uniref:Piezo type mechanosensitive ion channel component 1 (Er blood group) n=1 Tax=Cyclopterus lumpus TaxID=8103 RepID=A0A8C2ZE16_CYCLU